MTLAEHIKNLPLTPALDALGEWVCCINAKTATRSMIHGIFGEREILRRHGRNKWNCVWNNLFASRLDAVCVFTFVRNPWDRIVSAFHYLQQGGKINQNVTFRKYVTTQLAVVGTGINRHFYEQAPTFLFQDRPIPGMFVGRFERLKEDWTYIAGKLRVSETLPHLNASRHAHYATYYDDESRRIIGSIYRLEIEALGYEFEK